MNFFELSETRQSCRSFSNRPLEKSALSKILECASLAPSACNCQPWSFIVVTSEEGRKVIASACAGSPDAPHFTRDVPCFVIVVCESEGISKVCGRNAGDGYSCFDNGIVTEAMCLGAAELGVASCILGFLTKPSINEAFGVPADKKIFCAVALGYAAEGYSVRPKKRRALSDIVREEKY